MKAEATCLEELYRESVSDAKKTEYKYIVEYEVPPDCVDTIRIWGDYYKFSLGYVDKRYDELVVFTSSFTHVIDMSSGDIKESFYR